jgi:hypothetical protein
MNLLTLAPADVTMEPSALFDNIRRFRIVLLDGAQYGLQVNGYAVYDCRSISARGLPTVLP